jgi:Tol biopolymer transport system component
MSRRHCEHDVRGSASNAPTLRRPGPVTVVGANLANFELFVVNVDGSGLRQIPPGGLPGQDRESGSWSPNGKWILFGGRGQLHLVHPDGTAFMHTLQLAGISSLAFAFGPELIARRHHDVFALFTPQSTRNWAGRHPHRQRRRQRPPVQQVTNNPASAQSSDDTPD